MLRASRKAAFRCFKYSNHTNLLFFSSTSRTRRLPTNPPLHLDSSLQALLDDVDLSLTQHHQHKSLYAPKELEIYHTIQTTQAVNSTGIDAYNDEAEDIQHRKSPAALFGSQQVGAVILPIQLQTSINKIIAESDKSQLHSDAKRLFLDNGSDRHTQDSWDTNYDKKYRSRLQAARHAERDGAAFASVALPAHYSAIYSVLDHVKRRLGPTWQPKHVIDWGAGTGPGLWASLYSFQSAISSKVDDIRHLNAADATFESFVGIEKREGLTGIARRLLRNIDLGGTLVSWQKTFKENGMLKPSDGSDTLALSAFMLSTLSSPLARKTMVKEMWESGAHVIVLIDHNTNNGFDAIAEAREYLLKSGRREMEDGVPSVVRGTHVVAPCPHDNACPLHYPGSFLVCGFQQRIQRPSFVRLTKHSNIGHEDVGYSYVVIQRGMRPAARATNVGRIGEVGQRVLQNELLSKMPVKELMLHDDFETASSNAKNSDAVEFNETAQDAESHPEDPSMQKDVQATLRSEAYQWPRLVFPPLKRSGHIILDACTAEGKIMRMTIPKSQGKQAYYDARKSSWGDIFPHPPKNPPQERKQSVLTKGVNNLNAPNGSDIGKRRNSKAGKSAISYRGISDAVGDKKKSKRNQNYFRNLKAWDD